MTGSFLGGGILPSFGLEITGVNGVEAPLLHAEIFQSALHGDDLRRGLRPNIAVSLPSPLADAGAPHAGDPRDQRQTFGEPRAIGLDVDHIAAAENFTA